MMKKINLWHYIKHYKFNSIFIRNFVITIMLVIMPITVISTIIYYNNNILLENEVKNVNINSLYRIMDITDTLFKEAGSIAVKISLDTNVELFLKSSQYNSINENAVKNITNLINSYSYVFKAIDSIYVYSETNKFIITSRESANLQECTDKTWYETYKERDDNEAWIEARRMDNAYPYFISSFVPAYTYSSQKFGMVIININIENLSRIISVDRTNSSDNIFIIDKNNKVLFNKDLGLIGKNASEIKLLNQVMDVQGSYSAIKTIDGKNYVVSLAASTYQNNKYVSLLPLENFGERFGKMRNFLAGILIAGLLIAILSSLIISIKTFKPLENIISLMESPAGSQERLENGEQASEYAGNEIRYILNNISKTMRINNQQETELKIRLELLKNAQAAALLAQINPHFLYNTLETINIKAIRLLKHNNEVSGAIADLSDLLRLSLENDKHLATIYEEMEHAELYIKIMKMRYEDKFSVVWDVDSGLADCRIVKICLQPVLENSIYHGIKPKRENVKIIIRGRPIGQNILIEVIDEGVGMSPERCAEINQTLRGSYVLKGDNVGLVNVNQRIKLIFGEEYGLTVYSELNKGTRVQILFPKNP